MQSLYECSHLGPISLDSALSPSVVWQLQTWLPSVSSQMCTRSLWRQGSSFLQLCRYCVCPTNLYSDNCSYAGNTKCQFVFLGTVVEGCCRAVCVCCVDLWVPKSWKIGSPSKISSPPFSEWSCSKGCFSLESTSAIYAIVHAVKQRSRTM